MLTHNVMRSLLMFLTFFTISCGPIRLGSAVPNDQIDPDWVLVESGSFSEMNGQNIGGTASVYRAENGAYVVNINGISAPAEGGLQVVVIADGIEMGRTSLRSTGGSQNYQFDVGRIPGDWQRVDIHSTFKNLDYAQAVLQRI
jgi:hypothetical protein